MRVVAGRRARLLRTLMALDVLRLALGDGRGPRRAARALRRLTRLLAAVRDPDEIGRCALAGGRVYTHVHAPGWPSRAFARHLRAELAALETEAGDGGSILPTRLQSIIFAITKRCDLRCEHCCEWQQLDRPEALSAADLGRILARFRELGVTQVHFSGGEPLRRLDDLLDVARREAGAIDCWLFTSGVGLDRQTARRLRRAGVRGINLSVDHWRAAEHDAFRGVPGTFAAAMGAAEAACEAGLALCLTVCATRSFTTPENLRRYADLAGRLGAGFIQILEARAVGRYAGRDVALTAAQVAVLDTFVATMNRDARRAAAPLVVYPAGDQRRLGCVGAGRRYLYVDPDGLVHPCPFCRDAVGSALAADFPACLDALRRRGCEHPAMAPRAAVAPVTLSTLSGEGCA
jgi:MoaA/NifB/PqqE/SkfB family radical SAM enzyme